MLGTVFHYAVVEPKAEHVDCFAQVQGIIAYHESIGYRRGGAYNGHFCVHGGRWVSYLGPNQATGDTWANLNLHAWCYLGTVDTPVTDPAAQAAYDLTLIEPTGRDEIHPHSDFYQTSCCGDPLRAWIAAGALPPASSPAPKLRSDNVILYVIPSGPDPKVRGALFVQGNVIVREITGPINEYGVPVDASNWRNAMDPVGSMPILFLTGPYDGPAVDALRLGDKVARTLPNGGTNVAWPLKVTLTGTAAP